MKVEAALIMMTVLGCDDSGVECTPVEVFEPKWETIAACDADAENVLDNFTNSEASYPMIVAVCETPVDAASVDTLYSNEEQASAVAENPADQLAEEAPKKHTLADIFAELADKSQPLTRSLKSSVDKPVHVVKDGYAWIIRKIKH
jgi:hypothetical protein